jgi:hypothetical protein
VNGLVTKPCLHGPGRHPLRDLSGSGGLASIIGRRVRRYLSAPSPHKSLFPFHFCLPFGCAVVSGSGRRATLSPWFAAVHLDRLAKDHPGARRTERPSRRVRLDLHGYNSLLRTVATPYAPGNRGLWLKIKCLNREEFVVVGWTAWR